MPTAAVLAVSSIGGALASNSASKKAVKASSSAADKASLQTLQSKNRARQDLELLFPQAQQSANQGFQSALDVFGQSVPAQSNAFQQGNIGAQQAILSGLPQIQNALAFSVSSPPASAPARQARIPDKIAPLSILIVC